MNRSELAPELLDLIRRGCVIPAHPLALTAEGDLDIAHQRALTRYYIDAGAGGIAVGVHSTQFEIRDPDVALYRPVLELAAETVRQWRQTDSPPCAMIAGVCGPTDQAVEEAKYALGCGYHAALLSLSALADAPVDALIAHCERVSEILPLVGFYLQPAVGGRLLPYDFWRRFCEIDNVIAIKIAPFNRYQTLDVIRGLCEAGRQDQIALYTGNDDNIVADLLTPYRVATGDDEVAVRIVGGLLGQWAVWTREAVGMLGRIHALIEAGDAIPGEWLTLAGQLTEANAALFDPAHAFAGCIPGIHEALRRVGLMVGRRCLNAAETLSPGQMDEIDRVWAAYPHLRDDAFVREHLDAWLAP